MASVSVSNPNQLMSATLRLAAGDPSCTNSRQQPSRVSAAYGAGNGSCNSTIASQASLYQVLGIPMGATRHEIKAAYRRLARVLHPDVKPNNASNGRDDNPFHDFRSIHEAYTTLCDPKKRDDYDRTLFWQRRVLRSTWVLSAGNRNSGYTCRNWETDQCW